MGEKELTFIYQILALSFIVLMIISICSGSKPIVDNYLSLPFLLVSAFIATYLKSHVKMYKEEKAIGEKCYIIFSICLPIIHLIVGCIYCIYLTHL